MNDYVLYCDTDSVVGESIIKVNGEEIAISDFYDKIEDNFIYFDSFNQNYIKEVVGCITNSFNNGKIETNKIKYVMKHLVEKEMFQIEVNGKSVIVTEDHSIIVKRKEDYLSVSPKFIKKNDKIINI